MLQLWNWCHCSWSRITFKKPWNQKHCCKKRAPSDMLEAVSNFSGLSAGTEEHHTAADLWTFGTGTPHRSAGRPTLLITAGRITLLPWRREGCCNIYQILQSCLHFHFLLSWFSRVWVMDNGSGKITLCVCMWKIMWILLRGSVCSLKTTTHQSLVVFVVFHILATRCHRITKFELNLHSWKERGLI